MADLGPFSIALPPASTRLLVMDSVLRQDPRRPTADPQSRRASVHTDAVPAKACAVAEKARDEGRELTAAETAEVDAAIS